MTERRRIYLTPYWQRFVRRWLATIVCTLAISTLIFGLGGFAWQYFDSSAVQNQPPPNQAQQQSAIQDWSIPVFKTVQLFLLNSGADDDNGHPNNGLLIIARLSAASLFLVVSSAVILRVLDDVRRLPSELSRRDHVVICGLGQIGLQLLDDLGDAQRAKHVIIVENNPANPWLEYARNLGAAVVIGDSTRGDTLRDARALYAKEIFIVNGDDGANLEVAAALGNLFEKEGIDRGNNRLRVHVHIVDTNFATALRPFCKVLHDSPNMSVQVFNVPQTAAARLVAHQLWPYAPKEKHEVAHFVILGFGAMGQALAIQLAQLAHFPNRKRSRFTIADRNIASSALSFLSRFSRFTSWTDESHLGVNSFPPEADSWEWNEHPHQADVRVDSPEAIQYACNAEFVELPSGRGDERFAIRLGKRFAADGVKPVIFICGQQDRENFEMAVQLRDQLACYGQTDVPTFVWLPRQPALAETLLRTKDGNFVPFGECRSAASYQEITAPMRECIGRKIHDDYEQQAVKAGYRQAKEPWSTLRDEIRESNRSAADHLIIKLAVLGLKLQQTSEPAKYSVEFDSITKANALLLAEMEHYRWVAERLLAGWRYMPEGPTREQTEENKKRELNHNLVAWDRLGADRKKDFDHVRTVLRECQNDKFAVEMLTDS